MLLFFFTLAGILLLFLVVEFQIHTRKVRSIPIRIHVNGTRGKSSVTRLIAGALREHGVRTFAKTTGTLPRVVMADGKEYPVYRPARANIIEQLRIISLAASHQAQALVIECMALQPRLQALTELQFVRSTHGVITNARLDHLDVMGPSEKDVALALMGTIPHGGKLFTAEGRYGPDFQRVCEDRKSTLVLLEESDVMAVTDQDMAGFRYVEHKENVALVLKVCSSLDVPRDVALRGMWNAKQDPGAMSECIVDFFGRKILFINGFAANSKMP